jgi:predicted metal-dependent hydrolase
LHELGGAELRSKKMMVDDWPAKLPASFYIGLAQLERGEYFTCHETLEALWTGEKASVRELYQGVIQIAVGCYHLTAKSNFKGAVNKLDQGARRLERAGARGYGVDWDSLIRCADRLQAHLMELGSERICEYDASLLPNRSFYGKSVANGHTQSD